MTYLPGIAVLEILLQTGINTVLTSYGFTKGIKHELSTN